jgi:hypothetical protein
LGNKGGGVLLLHCGLVAIYITKYLKAKEENYESSNISPMRKYNNLLQKQPLKRNQNPSRY